MSMRQGWTYNGTHFTKTTTERGGTRYFVDGVPVKHADWRARMSAAKAMNETTIAVLHHGYSKTNYVALETIARVGMTNVQVKDNGTVVFVTGDEGMSRDDWAKLCTFHGTPFGTDHKGQPRQLRVCGAPAPDPTWR